MVTLSSILPPVNVTTVSGTLAVTNGGTGVTTSTGTGSVVLSNSPTLVTPVLGAASATSVTAALGSVTAPSFTFTGDTNTGIWSPAADTIAFSEGGVEAMRIDSSANVGIGLTSPGSYGKLASIGTIAPVSPDLSLQGLFSAANDGQIRVGGYKAAGTPYLVFTTATDVERMRITSAGNVGIGTASPAERLEVAGNLKITGSNLSIAPSTGTSAAYVLNTNTSGNLFCAIDSSTGAAFGAGNYARVLYSSGAYPLAFFTNDAERMRIIGSGYVGIGTTAPNGELQVKTAGGQWRIETNGAGTKMVGVNAADTGEAIITMQGSPITFFSNGSERMRIDSSGNVGIGTTSPLSRLDVREANRADSTNISNVGIYTTTAQSTGVGGTLALGGLFNGSDNAPFASIRGGKQNSISNNYDGYLAFQTIANGGVLTEKMRIDSGGGVGIGTSAVDSRLHVELTGVAGMRIGYGGLSSNYFDANANIFRLGNGTETMRINSDGNVGIGTTTPAGKLSVVSASSQFSTIANWANYTVVGPNAGSSTGAALGFGYNTTSDLAEIAAIAPGVAWKPLVLLSAGMRFNTSSGGEAMRLDTSGNLLVGVSSGSSHIFSKNAGNGAGTTNIFEIQNAGSDVVAMFLSGTSYGTSNSAGTALRIGRSNTTSRSINAGGTINASGADYAEYMVKAGDFSIEKGEVCGINSDGLLTKDFSEAISFAVKSTDPAYVGGDVWGAGCGDDPDALELARQTVDRIAFAGQVPVNVYNAVPGQYIIPVDAGGSIGAEAVSNPTFEQYQLAVGKVIAIEQDGRAKIIVKIA